MPKPVDVRTKALVDALRGVPAVPVSRVDARLVGGAKVRPERPRKPPAFIIGARG
jgi:hypothetical protein